MNEAFFRKLYSRCKMHGAGGAQVIISDAELNVLLSIALDDLGWSHSDLGIDRVDTPNGYYTIPMSWFDEQAMINVRATALFNH
jgi:hypothetical protein